RAGVMERLGIDAATLRAVNPRLVTSSITSFGETGPGRDRPAFDLIIQATSGAMAVTGEPGRPPARFGFAMGDLAGGLYAAIGVLAALLGRERGAAGRGVRIFLEEALTALSTYLAQFGFAGEPDPPPLGSAHPAIVPYGAFESADGWLTIGVIGEKFWPALCRALGDGELARDARFADNRRRVENRAVLEPLLARRFRELPTAEWIDRLRVEEVP